MHSNKLRNLIVASIVSLITAFSAGVSAKSVYLLADTNDSNTPIQAYDIQGTSLVFQSEINAGGGFGGVGMAVDSDNAILFVTHEGSGTFLLHDATTMASRGSVVATGASNLAGVAFDRGNSLLYVVDRSTTNLFVYDYNGTVDPPTLTPVVGSPFTLANLGGLGAYGIALDETNALLYVANRTATVHVYNTSDWSEAGTEVVGGTATPLITSVAIDVANQLLYTGGGFVDDEYLRRHDIAANTTTDVLIDPTSGAVGIAVDQSTGLVYTSTGDQGGGGTNDLRVYDMSLTLMDTIPAATVGGDPTGIAVPEEDISFNPLNFTKTDDFDPVLSGTNLTYTLCYDNTNNPMTDVTNVTITDDIPAGTTFVSATGSPGMTPTTVTWDIGTVVANAAQACVDLVVTVTAPGDSTITNTATITGTIVETTIPTTVNESTDVTGEVSDVIFRGKGEGGSASAGPLELLLGLFVLPLVLARRGARRAGTLLLAGVCLTMVVTSTAMAAGNGWYAGAGIGGAKTDASSSEYDVDLAGLGYTASSTMDDTDIGWKLFGGYEFTENWAVEGAYVDLGEVTSTTTVSSGPVGWTPQDFVDAAATVHPYSVDGFAITGKGTYPFGNGFSAFAKVGVFFWDADILVSCVGCSPPAAQPDGEDGTDFTGGLGVGYDFANNFGVRAEWERFGTDRDDVDFFSASVLMRF